jgi:hypothetical protein
MKINEVIHNITEATFDLDSQVDFVYNALIKDYREHVMTATTGVEFMRNDKGISSLDLPQSDDIDAANKTNSVTIRYGTASEGNQYMPNTQEVTVSMNHNVVELIHKHGGIDKVIPMLNDSDAKRIKTELTTARIKGSIYHELAHWLDDTLHNRHIKKHVDSASGFGNSKSDFNQGHENVALTSFERDAQIHSIKQLKRENEDKWDTLSFEQMIKLNASLWEIANTAQNGRWYSKWKKLIAKRMHREGLLGNNMNTSGDVYK